MRALTTSTIRFTGRVPLDRAPSRRDTGRGRPGERLTLAGVLSVIRPLRLAGSALFALVVLSAVLAVVWRPASAQPSELPRRGVVPMVASDGIFTGGDLPAPDPSYCAVTGGTQQPSAVFGLVTIGGLPAPASTVVQLSFDGKAGPAERVTVDSRGSGYSLIFDNGGPGCANRVGAAVSLLVNGQAVSTGKLVGDIAFDGYLFNIAIP